MTRLTDLPPAQAKRLAEVECPNFATTPFVSGPQLSQRTHRDRLLGRAVPARTPSRFAAATPTIGSIPGDITWEDLLTSHISVNFDRTGLQEDWNVAFPLDRMRELAAEGVIGSVADTHYSFMGASRPVGDGAARPRARRSPEAGTRSIRSCSTPV